MTHLKAPTAAHRYPCC